MIKLAVKYVKKEEEQTLRQWLSELNRRRDEVLETFSQEGTRHEQGYLAEIARRTVLIYIMDMEDSEHAAKAFKDSSLPIDLEHRRIMERVLDERVKLELLYECIRERVSTRRLTIRFLPTASVHVWAPRSHVQAIRANAPRSSLSDPNL